MKDYWSEYPDIASNLERVRELLGETSKSRNPVIQEALGELFSSPGKMLRPAFLLISSQFGSPDTTKILRMATAVELLHIATLVHDDVIDEARMRRGQEAIHVRYGRKRAILLGDYLFSKSFSLISEYANPENSRKISRAVMQICSGEISQASVVFTLNRSIREYLQRIAGKTAVLFALSCYVGAVESGAAGELPRRLQRIGYDIGMGFQIIDDILDFEGSETVVGKPVGNDLRQGIYTLPLILAIRKGTATLDRLLQSSPYSDQQVREIIAEVKKSGGLEGARTYAARYTERAFREIGKLPDGQPKETLHSLTGRLLQRKY